uniref:THD domain-containing protein n=1 Tax=Castor canadensis TaxID=51338 RepID=A0A8C0XJE9_CASCN
MDLRPDVAADPEAPWPPAPRARACRPLLWTLCASLLLLTATCAACVARIWMMSLEAPPASPSLGPSPSPRSPEGLQGPFSIQDGGVTLENGILSWYSQPGLAGVFLSPGLSYNEHQRELVIAKTGTYFVFLRLKLHKTLPTANVEGTITLALQLQPPQAGAKDLTLTVKLQHYSGEDEPELFGGRLLHLDAGQRLSARLGVHLTGNTNHWQLAQHATVGGLRSEAFLCKNERPYLKNNLKQGREAWLK